MNNASAVNTSPKPMSQAQSLESLRAHATAPVIVVDYRAAKLLLATAESIQALDVKIASLQSQLDELPAQETAISEDRTKSPADVRVALVALKDHANDLRFEQKRLGADRAEAFAKAVALFPQCELLVQRYFSGLYESEKSKAVTAVAPFFTVGASTTPERIAAELPTVAQAQTHALYARERVKGESPEETLAKYIEVIKEFGLHKPQAA